MALNHRDLAGDPRVLRAKTAACPKTSPQSRVIDSTLPHRTRTLFAGGWHSCTGQSGSWPAITFAAARLRHQRSREGTANRISTATLWAAVQFAGRQMSTRRDGQHKPLHPRRTIGVRLSRAARRLSLRLPFVCRHAICITKSESRRFAFEFLPLECKCEIRPSARARAPS